MSLASSGNPSEFYCAKLSAQKGEQLFGTATRADNWLLLTYYGPFTRKPFDDSNAPQAVKDHLTTAARSTPHTRIQLIKRLHSTAAQLSLYVALTATHLPRLYRFQLSSFEEIRSLDIVGLLADSDLYASNLSSLPVYLVCTHGAHDRCCAQWGLPVFKHLSQRNDVDVWQTNHIGGHRFAANLLCLPTGSLYGRVTEHSADAIVDADQNQLVITDYYRGRANIEPVAQAAEYFARVESGITAFGELNVSALKVITDTITAVIFKAGTSELTAVVQRMPAALRILTSCGAAEESNVDQYRLLEYRVAP